MLSPPIITGTSAATAISYITHTRISQRRENIYLDASIDEGEGRSPAETALLRRAALSAGSPNHTMTLHTSLINAPHDSDLVVPFQNSTLINRYCIDP